MNQRYRDFEVIVVNDASEDDSLMVLAQLKTEFPQLYYTSIPIDRKFSHGKKLAITVGIKAAKHEHLVFIDADCAPVSDKWLSEIASKYGDKKHLVIGYGKYAKRRGFLNFFIRYETFFNAVQYFGYAVALRPFMGVGRNLSYTKTLYDTSSKFRNNLKILSGDDDMFVSEVGTRANTAICFSPAAHTISEPKTTWGDWMEQKARHLTTAPLYPKSIKLMLGLEVFTRQLLFLMSLFMLLTCSEIVQIVVTSALLFRMIVIYSSLYIASRRMGEKKLWAMTLFMDVIVPWIQAIIWLRNLISKRTDIWK